MNEKERLAALRAVGQRIALELECLEQVTIAELQKKLAAEKERADYAWKNTQVIDAERMKQDVTIAELRQRLEWQPIETAPKDGSLILMTGTNINYPVNQISTGFFNDHGVWECYGVWISPTHWMPLPNLPALADGERYAGVRRSPI